MLTLNPQPIKSKGQRIREAFGLIGGGMSTAGFTHHCMEMGVWTAADRDVAAFTAFRAEVRRELRSTTTNGLPFAGQTTWKDEDGAPIWQQRDMWSLDDYVLNIKELRTQSNTLDHIAQEMYEEAVDRYGELAVVSRMRKIEQAA